MRPLGLESQLLVAQDGSAFHRPLCRVRRSQSFGAAPVLIEGCVPQFLLCLFNEQIVRTLAEWLKAYLFATSNRLMGRGCESCNIALR